MKLSPRYYGPFQVIKKIETVAYQLALPPETKIHPVFHVSKLKKRLGDHVPVQAQLPNFTNAGQIAQIPLAIIDRRKVKKGRSAITEVLVHWQVTAQEDATWEQFHSLVKNYPHLRLEDKAKEGGT